MHPYTRSILDIGKIHGGRDFRSDVHIASILTFLITQQHRTCQTPSGDKEGSVDATGNGGGTPIDTHAKRTTVDRANRALLARCNVDVSKYPPADTAAAVCDALGVLSFSAICESQEHLDALMYVLCGVCGGRSDDCEALCGGEYVCEYV